MPSAATMAKKMAEDKKKKDRAARKAARAAKKASRNAELEGICTHGSHREQPFASPSPITVHSINAHMTILSSNYP